MTEALGGALDAGARRSLAPLGSFGPFAVLTRLFVRDPNEILLVREDLGGGTFRDGMLVRPLALEPPGSVADDVLESDARRMTQLAHPHLARVVRMGREAGRAYVVVEWVDGASLGALVLRAQAHPTPPNVAAFLIARVAEGLAELTALEAREGAPRRAHALGPDHVHIGFDGTVRLVDFARAVDARSGGVYVAPELRPGAGGHPSEAADVYALGAILFAVVAGRAIPAGDAPSPDVEVTPPVLRDAVPDVPRELDQLVAQATSPDPSRRPATLRELAERLDRFVAGRGEVVNARRVAELMGALFPAGGTAGRDAPRVVHNVAEDPGRAGLAPKEGGTRTVPLAQGAGRVDVDERALREIPMTGPPAPPPTPAPPSRLGAGSVVGILVAGLVVGAAVYMSTRPERAREAPPPPATLATRPPSSSGLIVRAVPEGATVAVDGIERGAAPVTLAEIAPGEHRVRVTAPGHEVWEEPVRVRGGYVEVVQARLRAEPEPPGTPPATGRFTIESTPAVDVYLAGRKLGRTPLRAIELPAGALDVELDVQGERVRRTIFVPADRAGAVAFDFSSGRLE